MREQTNKMWFLSHHIIPHDILVDRNSKIFNGRVEPKVQGSSPSELFIHSFFFFSVFCVVVFYKYIAK